MKLKISGIRGTLEGILVKKGILTADARTIADEYLEGELQGKVSHGLMAFPSLVQKLGGKMTKPKILKKSHSIIFIDAKGNLGAVVGRQAAEAAIKMAKKEGVGLGLIKDMVTWMRPGILARFIANQGFIGIVINNGGHPVMSPPGGYDPVIGTNPIGIGIPTENDPLVGDMATSVKAWGEVRKAEVTGEDLPENSFYDTKGNFAVKAQEAYSALPFGDYKGFALGLLIEILTGSFLGRKMGQQVAGDYRTITRGGVILVLDPNFATNFKQFKQANSELIKEIKKTKKLKSAGEITLMGERAAATRNQNFKNGYLEVLAKLWRTIESF